MVLKEDLCAWFKELQPRKRIDYMCGLLDMCVPLELRFIGTVLEDVAKKDFNYLRDAEIKANIASNIEIMNDCDSDRSRGKTCGLMNEVIRARMHVYLALLHSNNTSCANVMFNLMVKQFDYILHYLQNREILEDMCSILTFACHHPAFQFYQRLRMGEVLKTLEARTQHLGMDVNEAHLNFPMPTPNAPVFHRPVTFCNRPPMYEQIEKARIRFIQVKGYKTRDEHQNKKGAPVYEVHTTWSSGEVTQVFLKYKEFQDIHHKLMNTFPELSRYGASIPELPAHRKYREEQKEGVSNLNTYLNELMKTPAYVLECDILTQPLHNGKLLQPAGIAMNNTGAIPSLPYFHRVPMYTGAGSQVYEYKYSQDPSYRMAPYTTYQYPSLALAATSPRTSHLSSTTTSPANSRSSSPASNSKANIGKNEIGNSGSHQNLVNEDMVSALESVLQLLRLCDLEKYSENLSEYSFEQLLVMSKEDFGKAGLPPDAQVKLRSKLDQTKPQDINGLIEIPGYTSGSEPSMPVQHIPVWPIHPSQEVLLNSGQPSSGSHQPFNHPVSSIVSPQVQTAGGENSPANSEVCSPSLSPALHPSDSPHHSPVPNVARGSGVALPPSTAMSLKSGRILQVDSSGSEDDRVSGIEGSEVLMGNQGFGRAQVSNSLPLNSQMSGPPGFLEKKMNVMPHMHKPDAALESNTPGGIPVTSVPVSLVNGFISDTTNSFMPPNASSVIPPRMLSTRAAFKHAQPTHTAPARHQNTVNMPGLDLHGMNKNGNGLNQIMPSPHLHQYMVPPPTQGNSVSGHPGLQVTHSAQNSSGQPIMHPSAAGETGNGIPLYPLMYMAHPNHMPAGTIPHHHRDTLNTMANSTVIGTTQSHPTLPNSHSPSPVASVITSDQISGRYIPGNSEVSVEARQDGRTVSPPSHGMAPGSGKPNGPNSGTPSPPLLPSKQSGNVNCDSHAPSVFMQQIHQPYMIPIHGHNNGLVTPMPPPFPFPSNHAYPNGFAPEVYLHRFPGQLGGGQVPFHLYGNNIYSHPMHSNMSNSGVNTVGNIKSGCYNCGLGGHKAIDCKENTMDSMTKPFSLNLNPNSKLDPE